VTAKQQAGQAILDMVITTVDKYVPMKLLMRAARQVNANHGWPYTEPELESLVQAGLDRLTAGTRH
jgi:hypothetical protein